MPPLVAKLTTNMLSRTSGRCASSVPGSDHITHSNVKKGSHPHPPTGTIFKLSAALSAAAGRSTQSNVQYGEQSITGNPTESQNSKTRGSTNVRKGVPPLSEHHGFTLS